MELLITQLHSLPGLLRRAGIVELIHGSFRGRRESSGVLGMGRLLPMKHGCQSRDKAKVWDNPQDLLIFAWTKLTPGVREGERHLGTRSTL